jgi:HPt (histidine-containing phosphotransfer) domain-containing protein
LAEAPERRAARAALFGSELLRRIDAIARAVDGGRTGVVATEANALATGALAIGLTALAEAAGRAEWAARTGDRAEIDRAFRILQCGVHPALAELRGRG